MYVLKLTSDIVHKFAYLSVMAFFMESTLQAAVIFLANGQKSFPLTNTSFAGMFPLLTTCGS